MQLLTVIKVVALVRQLQRERDALGRVIASYDDYKTARWLFDEIFGTAVSEGVTPAIRQTVEAVARLSSGTRPVKELDLVRDLGLAKSSINYRVHRALKAGYLIDHRTVKGAEAQLLPGAPLPTSSPLPMLDDLSLHALPPSSEPNLRTEPSVSGVACADAKGEGDSWGEFEPRPHRVMSRGVQPGWSQPAAHAEAGVRLFERLSGPSNHKEGRESEQLPWDDFLDEVEGNDEKPS